MEIFVVEVDSASGSFKQGQDHYSQAILSLRERIFNIKEQLTAKRMDLKGFSKAFSLLIEMKGSHLDEKMLRHGWVKVTARVDAGGVMFLTFLWRSQLELIEQGQVFIAK